MGATSPCDRRQATPDKVGAVVRQENEMSHAASSEPTGYPRSRPFALTLLFGVAAFTIALAGARSIGDIIGPVFLALVLTVTLHPVRVWLEGTRLPAWGASILMLLAA